MGRIVAGFEFSDWQTARPTAGRSFLLSLTLHVAVTAAAFSINPRPAVRSFPEPQVGEILEDEAQRLIWYRPKAELPAVAPAEEPPRRPETAAQKPRYRLPQAVTADDPTPQSLRQMVRTDAPEISIDRDIALPNIVSWKAPKVEAPRFESARPQLVAPPTASLPALEAPKVELVETAQLALAELERTPRLRFQAEQQQQQSPEQRALEAEAAPRIAAEQQAALDAARFQELARLRYQAAGTGQPTTTPERRALADNGGPALSDVAATPGVNVDVSELQQLARLRYQAGRGGSPKPAPGRRSLGEVAAAPAPDVAEAPASSAGLDASQLQPVARLRYQGPAGGGSGGQGAAAPQQTALSEVAGGASLAGVRGADSAGVPSIAGVLGSDLPSAAPPGLGTPDGRQPGGTGGDENLVAISVNPANRLPDTLPRGQRRGSFSAGPDGGPGGGKVGSSGPASAAVRVPNLAISGPRDAPSRPAGGDGAGEPSMLERFTRRAGLGDLTSFPPPPIEITKDPPKIDLEDPFVGRPVYTMAVNMPNVTSYKGDWVMQFAVLGDEQEIGPGEDVEERLAFNDKDLTPPYPRIKVDPKYIADAVRERVEGVVVFYCVIHEDGSMTDLNLVKSLDDRLDVAAREAFEKWEFEAARRSGQRVAVETLVRIPFQLNPAVKMRY